MNENIRYAIIGAGMGAETHAGDITDPRSFPTLRHRTQLQEISDALLSGTATDLTEPDYLQALHVSDAIYCSAAEGREVHTSEIK